MGTTHTVTCNPTTYRPPPANISYEIANGNLNLMLEENLNVRISGFENGVLVQNPNTAGIGDISLIANSGVSVQSERAALRVAHDGMGGISVRSEADLTTTSEFSRSAAIFALMGNMGSTAMVTMRVTGGRVATGGDGAHAVHGVHFGTGGAVRVRVESPAVLTATGEGSHGIHAAFTSTGATGAAEVTVAGGSVTAMGAGAHGISLSSVAGVANAATIQGMVTGGSGAGRGVHLANGGTVTVGRGGLLRAGSGIAVQSAAGSLTVNVEEGGRIGRDEEDVQRIQGSEGMGDTTTITVQGVTLLEDNSPTGETVDVMYGVMNRGLQVMAEEDATVCGTRCWRWLFGEPTAPAPEPTAPVPGAAGGMSSRALALELLPQALLDLTRPARLARSARPADEPGAGPWFAVSGHRGDFRPASVSTLRGYRQQWLRAEAGVRLVVPGLGKGGGKTLVGLSGHYLDSSVDDLRGVAVSGAGAGLDLTGAGLGVQLRWQGVRGFYLGAEGRGAWYEGRLAAEQMRPAIGGFGWSVGLSGGRRLPWTRYPGVVLAPHASLSWAEVQVDRLHMPFAAAFDRGRSVRGRLGLEVECAGRQGGAQTRLQAAAAVEYEWDGETAAVVEPDDMRLAARPERLWGVLSLGASVSGGSGGSGGGPLARLGAKDYALSARVEGAFGASGNYEAAVGADLRLRF